MDDHRANADVANDMDVDTDVDLEELDEELDYEQIVERGDADRRAGRVVPHDEVERLVADWFQKRPDQRRRA